MSSALNYGYYLYTRDDGVTQVNVRVSTTVGGHASTGFAAMDTSKPTQSLRNKKAGLTCRYVLLRSSTTGNTRRVPIGSASCDLWTGVVNTISFPIRGSATPEVFDVTHRKGEESADAHAVFSL